MINTLQMVNSWFSQAMRGFAGYTNAIDHDYFFDASVDFEAQFGEDADLCSYFLELLDGRRFRLFQVISPTQVELFDPALEFNLVGQRWWIRRMDDPPDHLWAEVTYLDNRPMIESNFGRLIGFTLDDLAERTDNLDYLSAVQGLWSYVWDGRTVFKTRVSSQIILGLPFAEETGNIIGIESPFDGTRDRILVQSSNNQADIRSYLFPSELPIETNPETDAPYKIGDTVQQFAPLCGGVIITDYVKEPEWFKIYVGSGDLYEPQKIHTYGVVVDASVFDIVNLRFLVQYLRRYRPTYVDPLFVVRKSSAQTIDVADPMLLGPVVPPGGYAYPVEWPSFDVPITWASSPHEVPRSLTPTVPENLGISFGGLRLADVPGKMPDGWSGAWPSGAAGVHAATISEGSFRFDDTDESGHAIHRWDEHTFSSNLLLDGDAEAVAMIDWPTVDLGGSGQPLTAVKFVGAPDPKILSGDRSIHISSAGTHIGVQQSATVALDEGFQIGVNLWVYLVTGQAYFRLLDQDNPQTVLAEWRHASHQLQWHQLRLHAWEVSAHDTNFVTLQILTGPAGGDFYLDAEGTDDWQQIGVFEKAMPWAQWGYDRAIVGRTGGYTQGGLPDEDLTFQLAIPGP